jgi:LysM repeat protein
MPEASESGSPTSSTTPVATPEPEIEVWLYSVQVGDSISGVAIRFGTTTEELLVLNPEYRDNENLVQAGAQLIVPCTPIADSEDRC